MGDAVFLHEGSNGTCCFFDRKDPDRACCLSTDRKMADAVFRQENQKWQMPFFDMRIAIISQIAHSIYSIYEQRLISVINLMHDSFSLLQYVCYITILDMFRALTCPTSGGQIVLSHLVSSLSVNGCTICRMRAESALIRYTVLYRE